MSESTMYEITLINCSRMRCYLQIFQLFKNLLMSATHRTMFHASSSKFPEPKVIKVLCKAGAYNIGNCCWI